MAKGDNCSAACTTRDHETFGACMRSKSLRVAYCNSAGGSDYTEQKKWDANLDNYRALRSQGVQPAGTRPDQVQAAARISDSTGTAYQSQ